jgi:hypothetical protein
MSVGLNGYRNKWLLTKNLPGAYLTAAKPAPYNFLLEIPAEVEGDLDVPQGNGYGSFSPAVDGKLACAGLTADGLAYTSAGFVGPLGEVIIFATFKAPGGSIMGQPAITLAGAAGVDNYLDGNLSWNRIAEPVTSKGVTYRPGFNPVQLDIVGGKYKAPIAGGVVAGLTDVGDTVTKNAKLTFLGGGLTDVDLDGSDGNLLADTFTFNISNLGATVAQKVTLPLATDTLTNYNKVTFNLAATPLGQFTGTFTVPNVNKLLIRTAKFNAIIVWDGLAQEYVSAGHFLLSQPPQSGQTVTTSNIISGQVLLEKPF